MKQIKLIILLAVMAVSNLAFGQNSYVQKSDSTADTSLIQFSGLVLTSDSIFPIPQVIVRVKGSGYGIYSDLNGFFSFVARKGDTVQFQHVQFKNVKYIIPDTLSGIKYNVVQLMTQDTIYLPATIIRPLPNREIFDYVFVNKEVPDDKIERARKNLNQAELKERAANMDIDASENYRNYMANESKKLYYAGQYPSNNLLNPFAWASFFKAWQRGDFKSKKKE
jgi:hypothetical protein